MNKGLQSQQSARGRRQSATDRPRSPTRSDNAEPTSSRWHIPSRFRCGTGLFSWRRPRPSTRARLESIVVNLGLQEDWTIEEFFTAVETMRGRRIIRLLLPDQAPVGLCGLWLARPNDDVVFHRRCSDPTMERHVVSHEAAHMLLDHGRETSPSELASLLAGVDLTDELGSSVSMVQTARSANTYLDRAEYEAEWLATLLMTRARQDGTMRRDRMLRTF